MDAFHKFASHYFRCLHPGASPQKFEGGGQRREVKRMREPVWAWEGRHPEANVKILRNPGMPKRYMASLGVPGSPRHPRWRRPCLHPSRERRDFPGIVFMHGQSGVNLNPRPERGRAKTAPSTSLPIAKKRRYRHQTFACKYLPLSISHT